MRASDRMQEIERRLRAALQPSHLELIDDSARHAGHAGSRNGAGHYVLYITAKALDPLPPLKQHQLIYAALGDMMQHDIHALNIHIVSAA